MVASHPPPPEPPHAASCVVAERLDSDLERALESQWCEWLADSESTPRLIPATIQRIVEIDPMSLTPAGRLALLRCTERALAVVAAAQTRTIAAVSGDAKRRSELGGFTTGEPVDAPEREQVAVALRLAHSSASRRVDTALALVGRHPDLLNEMASGRISYLHAVVISDETSALSETLARSVASAVIPLARREAVGRVRRRTATLAARADHSSLARRHGTALTQRRITLRPECDGMASLILYTDAISARRAFDAVNVAALSTVPAGVSLGAARVDAAISLLLGGGSSERARSRATARAAIAVHTDIPTLLGLADTPAHVPGVGPVPAELARALASDADWVRFTHAESGGLTNIGRQRYRPTSAVADLVRARDKRCQFPHCEQPADYCDLDHIKPFDHRQPGSGGFTTPDNLQALCRRHHRMKTHGDWQVRREADGHLTWIGPAGETSRTEPELPP